VRCVEEWTDVEFELPEELTGEQAASAAVLAHIIRSGGRQVSWHDFEATFPADRTEPLRGGHVLRFEQAVGTNFLGRTVNLGFTQLDLTEFKVVSEEPAPEEGYVRVRIEPSSNEAATVFERLVKEPTVARDEASATADASAAATSEERPAAKAPPPPAEA
jgi:hypothetical protein